MTLLIYKWRGNYLRRNQFRDRFGLPGWAIHQRCCCNTCCGRNIPGPPPYKEGPTYYPLTMHIKISPLGKCACPDPPLTFDLEWDGNQWYKASESIGYCPGFYEDLTDIWLQCSSGNWYAHFKWGTACFDQIFQLTPVLNSQGQCDPFSASKELTITTTDPYCCGFSTPPITDKRILVEVWE